MSVSASVSVSFCVGVRLPPSMSIADDEDEGLTGDGDTAMRMPLDFGVA